MNEEIKETKLTQVLKVSGLSAEKRVLFGEGQIALRDVSFEIQPGEIVAFCGESGCGKSTLTRAIVGCLNPGTKIISGEIRLGNDDLLKLDRHDMQQVRRKRIGFLDREIRNQLNPDIQVRQHLRDTLQLADRQGELGDEKEWGPFFYEVGIVEPELILPCRSRDLKPLMIQRILLLTALFSGAELLICDEPTAELDDVAEMYFYEVLCQLRDERKLGILLTTNHLRGLGRIANQIHIMYEGGILESGEGQSLVQKPKYDYTGQLLNCTPDINQTHERLPVISRKSAQEAENAVHEKSSTLKENHPSEELN